MDITHQAMSSMAAILAKQKDDVFSAAITHVLGDGWRIDDIKSYFDFNHRVK